MEQRVSMITLGVSGLERARGFYEQLGWQGQTVQGTAFFQIGGLALVLWDRSLLAADADVELAAGPGAVVLAHKVRSPSEVDALLATVEAAGGRVTRPAAETFYGGYAGWFCDPDGHVWEVAHNPGFPLGDDGSLTVPDLSGA